MPSNRNITKIEHKIIRNPALHVVLYRPEIPSNTGNIARLCGASETRLHLVHPLGFEVDDKHLLRAGLDYWHEVDIVHHPSFRSLLEQKERDKSANLIAFSRHADKPYPEAEVKHGDWLLFGQETAGLPAEIHRAFPCYRIPIWGRVRSLNLATCAAILVYHFLHGMGRF